MIVIDIKEWRPVIYRDIKPDMYMVSNFGDLYNRKTKKHLHPWKGKNGYRYGSLMTTSGTVKHVGIHVLVAEMFIAKPTHDSPIVPNHLDFNRENNYVGNLEWTTYAENNRWNFIHGHIAYGEDSAAAKTTDKVVHEICRLLESGHSNQEIINMLNLEPRSYGSALVTAIRTGKRWKHISSKYDIKVKNSLRKTDSVLVDQICKLLERGYSVRDMRQVLGISNTNEEKARFKKLVWFIRTRQCYKDISCKYAW